MADDSGEKTEDATEKRMKEVHDKGQLSKSTDLSAWVGVGAAVIAIPGAIDRSTVAGLHQLMTLQDVIDDPTPARATAAMMDAFSSIGGIVAPMLAIVGIAVLITAVVQGGIHFKKSIMKFEHFNLLAGIKNMFGLQALWQGAKVLLKTGVVALVLWMVIQNLMPVLMTANLPLASLMSAAGGGVSSLVVAAVVAGLVLGGLDMIVVMRRNRKKTRMTKKEIKDESKSQDGDPLIKQQRRSRALAMSRNRMMSTIADADVVMINPTHVAVALKYEPGRSAPRVVAKGSGEVARRIREKAEAEGVPMVKDIPLARALHAACELNDEIPVDLYSPVARVLTFVMALKARGSRAAHGVHTMPGGTIAAAPEPPAAAPTTLVGATS
ncbi:flagellar biosynthesis protein FlhB [Frondihabitans sp. VKM Ac-2883]|uniref:EscU/YscU/HrcU family type III secretion system export apparatus switch protein n=1 Tax=Frondihabitans sp. VKM Ac-2883 TaxID=2783823 RepID=UPI00188BAC3F|nr:EscU/YscU/HrcU family type III secretion system export apparatus switch protein [Frondihabitans sp. VKM Ac-2883]MBF4574942.1 EscU/YscU/HrcU family type III secretion system export apparatus switch protein [Frondihabitans sp. VKM Ac-2883]